MDQPTIERDSAPCPGSTTSGTPVGNSTPKLTSCQCCCGKDQNRTTTPQEPLLDEYSAPDHLDPKTWKLYWDRAPDADKKTTEKWNQDLDTLLLFATLFSAVVTAFLVDIYKQLLPDLGDPSVDLLRQILQAQLAAEGQAQPPASSLKPSPFVGRGSATRINCFWFASLVISLSAAFLVILAKQWVINIGDNLASSPRMRGRQRQYRQENLELWKLPILLSILPILLHIALLLFLAGLVEFTFSVNHSVFIVTTILVGTTAVVYIVVHGLSFAIISCPYKTSVTLVVLPFLNVVVREIFADTATLIDATFLVFRPVAVNISPIIRISVSPLAIICRFIAGTITSGTTWIFSSRPIACFIRTIDQYLQSITSRIASAWRTVMHFRMFYKRWWMYHTIPWFAWRRRELQTITQSDTELEAGALAWIIDQSLWMDQTRQLAKELCRMFKMQSDRHSFIKAGGISLLAHELKATYNGDFKTLSEDDQETMIECSTTLARLATESDEDDPYTKMFFIPAGLPYNIDFEEETARSHLASSGICRSTKALHDPENIVFFASMLRLHVFHLQVNELQDNLEYSEEVVTAIKVFFDRGFNFDLDDNHHMIIVNTIIYICIHRMPEYKAIEALAGIVRSTLEMDTKAQRQICWAVGAILIRDGLPRGQHNMLIPTIRDPGGIYAFLPKLIAEHMDDLPLFRASLQILEDMCQWVVPNTGVPGESVPKDHAEISSSFADSLQEMATQFCSVLDSYPTLRDYQETFGLIVNSWHLVCFCASEEALSHPFSIDASPIFQFLDAVYRQTSGNAEQLHIYLATFEATCYVARLYISSKDKDAPQLLSTYGATNLSPDSRAIDPAGGTQDNHASLERLPPSMALRQFDVAAADPQANSHTCASAIVMEPSSDIQQPDHGQPQERSSIPYHPISATVPAFSSNLTFKEADADRIAEAMYKVLVLLAENAVTNPPESVTRGFLHMLTYAFTIELDDNSNAKMQLREKLQSRRPDIKQKLTILANRKVAGAPRALRDMFPSYMFPTYSTLARGYDV